MNFYVLIISIVILIGAISSGKIYPFLAFIFVSIGLGLGLGLTPDVVILAIQKGIGDILGSLLLLILLGAFFGKIVAESGAALQIARQIIKWFGTAHLQWGLMIAAFLIGIPLFYGVGFILMIPLLFTIVHTYRLSAIQLGLPMLAALSVTHGFLPPHPSPMALSTSFNADIGTTLLLGTLIAIPAVIIAGPIYLKLLGDIPSQPIATFQIQNIDEKKLPGVWTSFISALLPVYLLVIGSIIKYFSVSFHLNNSTQNILYFFTEPLYILLFSLLVVVFTLRKKENNEWKYISNLFLDATKDLSPILLLIAGSGALKQILTESGMNKELGVVFSGLPISPLILGWLMAAVIRVCIGSATIAGLSTAGIIAPMMHQWHIHPSLMVLSIGAGSLFFSHVNDPSFWLYKEYFNVSLKNTFRTWTMMETIVSVTGLIGVLLLNLYL